MIHFCNLSIYRDFRGNEIHPRNYKSQYLEKFIDVLPSLYWPISMSAIEYEFFEIEILTLIAKHIIKRRNHIKFTLKLRNIYPL